VLLSTAPVRTTGKLRTRGSGLQRYSGGRDEAASWARAGFSPRRARPAPEYRAQSVGRMNFFGGAGTANLVRVNRGVGVARPRA